MDQSSMTEMDALNGLENDEDIHTSPANVHSQYLDEADLHEQNMGTTIATGQDDAGCIMGELSLPFRILNEPAMLSNVLMTANQTRHNDNRNDNEDDFLDVPMPLSATGFSTFAYQRALKNRIRSSKLDRSGDYDTRAFTPTFVHDCLMLPGSLANVLGKGSAEQIIHRMTPALLPGFHAYIHMETEQPCLIQSDDPGAYVQGMLIFGEGKDGREQVHQHYRPYAKRIKVQLEVETSVPVPFGERRHPRERWILGRKRLWAHAWLWTNVRDFELQFRPDAQVWRLEAYLSGKYTVHQAMRVENGVGEDYEFGEEDDGEQVWNGNAEAVEDTSWVPEPEPDPREIGNVAETDSPDLQDDDDRTRSGVPSGGPGGLSWERSDAAIGRW